MKNIQKATILVVFLLLASCSVLRRDKDNGWIKHNQSLFEISDEDYLDHLASLSDPLREKIDTIKLPLRVQQYLESLHKQISLNNELLLNSRLKPRFYIIKDDRPFAFSLPKAQYFFSSEYLIRYIANEEIFVASFSHEIIRSHRAIYQKVAIIPVGTISIEQILGITKIPLAVRSEIHELTYFAIKRSGYDPNSILNWLQVLNKNSLAFSMQLGDPRIISREEFSFKNFLVNQKVTGIESLGEERNSSPGFYELINFLRRY
jgi:hypothetical protein